RAAAAAFPVPLLHGGSASPPVWRGGVTSSDTLTSQQTQWAVRADAGVSRTGCSGCSAARPALDVSADRRRSEEHTSELQSRENLVCRLLLEKKTRKHT